MTARPGKLTDARELAEMHVASWQGAYRGAYPDDFLDNLSVENGEAYWQEAIEQGKSSLAPYVLPTLEFLIGLAIVLYSRFRRRSI